MTSYLPAQEGLLPKWILLIGIVSIFNSLQCYSTTNLTRRVYCLSGPQTTQLSSRTFGTWTALTGIVRFYSAYRLSDPEWYQLALWTYGIATIHFMGELLVYRTTKVISGATPSFCVALGSLAWMWVQWDYYVR